MLIFDEEKEIWVHADASDYAIGAEISQLDKEGRRRPVVFYSRKLLPAEMNYTTGDKEMLAIVQVFKKFRHLLQGTKYPVTVKFDHRNLRTFMTTKELNARQARWAEELSAYDFVIEHIKGRENKVADALSRRPDYREENKEERKMEMLIEKDGKLTLNRRMKMKMVTNYHEDQSLLNKIKEETETSQERPELQVETDGFKRFKGMIFVPREAEHETMKRHHDDIREGHQGIARTVEKI